jgi:hypothetical protein
MRCQLIQTVLVALVSVGFAAPVLGQTAPPVAKTVSLTGPRVGVTFLSDAVVDLLNERQLDVGATVSQFGWQFEKQFYSGSGLTAVTEWVLLFGGLEQGAAIPSVSWLVGLRSLKGAEFGVGPNITPAGTALVVAAGHTFRSGALNVPVNLAIVPAKSGLRVSLLSGFNLRGRK